MQFNARRQRVSLDGLPVAQGIAFALHDQGGCLQPRQVRHPRFFRFAGGVKRVAQTDQSINSQLISHQTGHAPAHGLAANRNLPGDMLSHPGIHLAPAFEQFGLLVWRPFATIEPALRHVRELEAQYVHPSCRKAFSHTGHPGTVHRSTCTMGQDQGLRLRAFHLVRGRIP